ncbi:MAG: UDP-2,4-diacetamido-2,4,6-trideoxy-beta-L-altropyranose hydrolase [Sideroxyarcus sp.]|nr:UDP-2,4-diacetamido-2,4,6-trideoxy-beta-L-altropyranose hydrolase [Sideroxyarcus sp.]
MTNVAIRADATSRIGTGHFMRCLTLADALRQRGARIRFVSRDLPAHLCDMLKARGMELMPLSSNVAEDTSGDLAHSEWLGTSQAQDARDTALALSEGTWDWLVVDHYALDARWEALLRGSARQIMVIDDIADRQHDCDVLLDQNYYADMQTRYAGKVPEHCRLLLGPRYALLREEFRKLREHVKPRTGEVRRILVFFGGVDAYNYTGLAIEALAGLGIEGISVDVVIGAQHPRRSDIEIICATLGYVCHVQTSRMAELMAAADLAIGAGGSASWERCCLGVPALLVALAENQIDIAKALDSIGACIYLGTKEVTDSITLQRAIANLLDTHDQLEVVSQRAFSLVDGMGVEKVCQELGY